MSDKPLEERIDEIEEEVHTTRTGRTEEPSVFRTTADYLNSALSQVQEQLPDKARMQEAFVTFQKYNLSETTAVSTFVNPLYAYWEKMSGMTDIESLSARASFFVLGLAGLSGLYGYGKDISKKMQGIEEGDPDPVHRKHDRRYSGVFTAVTEARYMQACSRPSETVLMLNLSVLQWPVPACLVTSAVPGR